MLELLLLILFLRNKLKIRKEAIEEIKPLLYEPGLIVKEEIENSVQEIQQNIFQAAMLIYTQILSMLKDKTVIQFQMYGIGPIWRSGIHSFKSGGTIQYVVATKIVSKLKQQFPEITVTSQEPCHSEAEIEYLQTQNIHVFRQKSFSPNYFLEAAAKCNVSNPIMICYMIHFNIFLFEEFLRVHWKPEILSKIIFVGNWFGEELFASNISKCKKVKAFFNVVNRKTLPFERQTFIRNHRKVEFSNERKKDPHPLFGHSSDFLAHKAFHNTDIYLISYENAKKLVKKSSFNCNLL